MTQRELALRIDVNESTISRFLGRGKTEKLERRKRYPHRQSVQCVHGLYLGYDRNPG